MSFNTDQCAIPKEVVDHTGAKGIIIELMIKKGNGVPFAVSLQNFNKDWEEYIDPKDVEIQRLLKELATLKAKYKATAKKRRRLLAGEISEIKELISKGEANQVIAKEYEISDSTVSKIRVEMRKEGKDV